MKGRYIGPAVYDGQPVGVRGYKILQDDGDPNSVIVCQDVYFVETQFEINKPLPLAEPVRVTKWDMHHNDETDFDEECEKEGCRDESSEPEQTVDPESEENVKMEDGSSDEPEESEEGEAEDDEGDEDQNHENGAGETDEEEGPDAPTNPERRLRSEGMVRMWSNVMGRVWKGANMAIDGRDRNELGNDEDPAPDTAKAMLTKDGP